MSSDLIKQVLDKFFDNLNEMQRQAVFAVTGPVLILAGAGSGKTTAIINRIVCMVLFGDPLRSGFDKQLTPEQTAYLESYNGDKSPETIARLRDIIAQNPIAPWKIAAVTFTNKAAGELKERLSRTLGADGEAVCACTFHSFCMRILRRDIAKLMSEHFTERFTVYDSDDSTRLIKTCLSELDIDEKRFPSSMVRSSISKAKDRLIGDNEYEEAALQDNPSDRYMAKMIGRIYRRYQAKLRAADALDFDDIIMLTVKLLSENEDLRQYYSRRFPYMCVDEFQDTNAAQYRLAELICGDHKNLCVVGDDDQSIYKFRGATVENIMLFAERFDPKTIVIKLEQNYRSTGMILAAANSVISNNSHTIQKALWTENPTGERIVICKAPDGYAEGRFAADTVKTMAEQGKSYSDFAVLYRINAQSNAFERAFSAAGIPYRIIGGLRFYDRKEIKDILAYLHVLQNPRDMLHFRRIVNEPKRGIGEATLSMIEQIAVDLNVSPLEVCRESERFPQLEKKHAVLTKFADMIGKLSDLLNTDIPLADFIDILLHKTGYKSMLAKLETEGENRLANIGELVSDIAKFSESSADGDVGGETEPLNTENSVTIDNNADSLNAQISAATTVSSTAMYVLDGFLESIALYTDVDKYQPGEDAVSLLTVHSSKGLEWNTVFLVGMEEGIFPSSRSATEDIEEERRLAYVAITRAKERLFISHASERMLYGYTQRNAASRFIREIDKSTVEKIESGQDGTLKKAAAPSDSTYTLQKQLEDRKAGKPAEKSNEQFSPGERILHPKFGYGMIISAQEIGGDWMLEIMFEEVGTKKLMANFAKLKKA